MFGETSNAFTRNIQKFYTVCKVYYKPFRTGSTRAFLYI